jgi:hypothetical protein
VRSASLTATAPTASPADEPGADLCLNAHPDSSSLRTNPRPGNRRAQPPQGPCSGAEALRRPACRVSTVAMEPPGMRSPIRLEATSAIQAPELLCVVSFKPARTTTIASGAGAGSGSGSGAGTNRTRT